VVAEARTISYAELEALVLGMVGALEREGVKPGDRVAVLAANSVEMVEAIHAVPRAGAILVPLNIRLTQPELAEQLRDCGAALLLCDSTTAGAARAAASAAGIREPLTMPPEAAQHHVAADTHALSDVHSIVYTSGTTGRPKGAMLTFGNFWASAAGSAFNLGVTAGDRWLACMPLFHVGGLSIVLRSAIAGTTAVVHGGFDERAVARAIQGEGITHVSVVASMLQRVLDVDEARAPASLRVVLVGGGPVAPTLLERAIGRGFPVLQTYGLTEAASQVTTLGPSEAIAHLGSAGKPLVSSSVRIDAGDGEAGEILVSGPTVTSGYWGNPDATGAAIRDGWLHTGDIGRLDGDGYLFVLDRRDDLIVSGGENVYPAEVEATLLAFPGVIEAAVVGLPDARWGQRVEAVLVVGEGYRADGLDGFLRERLAGYKMPQMVRTAPELPKTASGKIQRAVVRRQMLDEQATRP
jgi:O-succinylbenzoic acid--CoA ligase